jgi:hypothetical protein
MKELQGEQCVHESVHTWGEVCMCVCSTAVHVCSHVCCMGCVCVSSMCMYVCACVHLCKEEARERSVKF